MIANNTFTYRYLLGFGNINPLGVLLSIIAVTIFLSILFYIGSYIVEYTKIALFPTKDSYQGKEAIEYIPLKNYSIILPEEKDFTFERSLQNNIEIISLIE